MASAKIAGTVGRAGTGDGADGAPAPSNRADPLRRLAASYGHPGRPLGSYAGITALFNLLLAGFLLAAKLTGRPLPDRVALGDVVLGGVATHSLSRLIAKDKVLSFLRAPFARFEEAGGPAEVEEAARGRGVQRAIGELVTCPYCVALWIAALFNYGLVLRPSVTRLVGSIFSTIALADFLHLLYAAAEQVQRPPDE